MKPKNYYEIFKLYPPVDLNQLQHAYKQLIFEFHPDRNPDRQEWAIERTMEIVEGYKILSDPEKREGYDFQIRNDIRREAGKMFGIEKGFLMKSRKSKEEAEAEECFKKGLAYFEDKDDWGQARHEWSQALKLVPGFANACYNLGVLFGYQGRFKEAVECFERVVRTNSSDTEAKKILGVAMGHVYGKRT